MIRLIAALAASRDQVDRAIALGEFIPRLERLRTIVLIGLVAAVTMLTWGYIEASNQLTAVRQQQVEAEAQRMLIVSELEHADLERDRILRALTGKSGASPTSTP